MSPSILLMGRRIRNKLDLIFPDFQSQQEQRGWKQLTNQGKVRHFTTSSPVLVRSYDTSDKWVHEEVTKEIGNMHYEVNVGGRIMKKHVDQLQPSEVCYHSDISSDHVNVNNGKEGMITGETIIPNVESNIVPAPQSPIVHRVLPDRSTRGNHLINWICKILYF